MIDIFRIITDLIMVGIIIRFLADKKESIHYLSTIRNLSYHAFSLLKQIQMNQQELAVQLQKLAEQQKKANAEISGKITNLENALANGGPVSTEVQAALDDLKSAVQAADDIVLDAVDNPPAPADETSATEEP